MSKDQSPAAKAPAKKAPAKKAPAKKAPAKKAPAKKSAAKTQAAITVRCKSGETFRRAGRTFGSKAELITDYTSEQLAAWQREPLLVVQATDAETA